MTEPDWPCDSGTLRSMASRPRRAYCPYSGLQVGAAALVDDGRIITGCNVENASYGLGLCAECTLVGQLRLTGGGRLVALACRSGEGDLLMPCGRCRQVIYEFGGAELEVDTPMGRSRWPGCCRRPSAPSTCRRHERRDRELASRRST